MHPVAAECPHSTLKGTPTCSSHIGTALYETQVVGQGESGCVKPDTGCWPFQISTQPQQGSSPKVQPICALTPKLMLLSYF